MTGVRAEIAGIKRMRRRACMAIGTPDRNTETDVRIDLMMRLADEVVDDLSEWLNAQVVSLHDPCQTLSILGRDDAERERER